MNNVYVHLYHNIKSYIIMFLFACAQCRMGLKVSCVALSSCVCKRGNMINEMFYSMLELNFIDDVTTGGWVHLHSLQLAHHRSGCRRKHLARYPCRRHGNPPPSWCNDPEGRTSGWRWKRHYCFQCFDTIIERLNTRNFYTPGGPPKTEQSIQSIFRTLLWSTVIFFHLAG